MDAEKYIGTLAVNSVLINAELVQFDVVYKFSIVACGTFCFKKKST